MKKNSKQAIEKNIGIVTGQLNEAANALAPMVAQEACAKMEESKEVIIARLTLAYQHLKAARFDVRGNWGAMETALNALAAAITHARMEQR